MKIKISNIGALKYAEFEVGKFTIICGKNNTGKTYATYAFFGFLMLWRELFSINISEDVVKNLMAEGYVELDMRKYIEKAAKILQNGCKSYTKQLFSIFASSKKHFDETKFEIVLDTFDISQMAPIKIDFGSEKKEIFNISKKEDEPLLKITLLSDKSSIKIPYQIIERTISESIKEIIFGKLFPNPFIASAERTGAAIFRKELNFARNRLLEEMSTIEKDIDPIKLLTKVYSDYALPVKVNVEFTRKLEELDKKESYITKNFPEILNDFRDIIGGEYHVTKDDELFFKPHKNKRLRLTMDESSSAVRSLLDIGFYIRHVAKKNDLLIVDEPELNLHPENQRKVARFFACLVNCGINVFITTHSDYIIRELNTLIMLNRNTPYLRKIAEREGYKPEEFIKHDEMRVYVADERLVKLDNAKRGKKCMTLIPADISPKLGIEVKSFDSTIETMHRIQEDIIWGEE